MKNPYFFYVKQKKQTPSEYIDYGLYLYFLGLSLRNVVKAIVSEYNQKKPCYNLELDSEVSSLKKDIIGSRKERGIRIHRR